MSADIAAPSRTSDTPLSASALGSIGGRSVVEELAPVSIMDKALQARTGTSVVPELGLREWRKSPEERVFETVIKYVTDLDSETAAGLISRFTSQGAYFHMLRLEDSTSNPATFQNAAIAYVRRNPDSALAAALHGVDLSAEPYLKILAIAQLKIAMLEHDLKSIDKTADVCDTSTPWKGDLNQGTE